MNDRLNLIRPALASASIIALCIAAPAAWAQDGEEAGPQAATPATTPPAAGVFEPAYFAQYAPRNALDMVSRLPGFTISGGNDNGQRGLGQANQNVVVNGERFSSKSDSLRDQLRRIPASDVIRIELVDGNTLDIPGLTGVVANVIYRNSGVSGQFRYNANYRPHNTDPALYGGEISLTGKEGALSYTVSLSNDNERFGADGPVLITAADGTLIEEQYSQFVGAFDNPKLATNFTYDFGDDVQGNLNLSYGEDFFNRRDPEIGTPVNGPVRTRTSDRHEDGPEYEIGADITFPLGPGKLKLIGLERFERDNSYSTLIDSFADDTPATGYRFDQINEAGERIGRAEYSWAMLDGDWQLSGEAAFNRLKRRSSLDEMNADGVFMSVPFPAGTGGVREDRYETSLSYSRKLSSKLSLQAIGAMEFSTIKQTGSAANSRSFKRPKGSLALTWKPENGFDISLTAARRVSQLSFGDFLASVSLNDDNQNGGNNSLVPYQSWNIELEANKSLGNWGSIKFEARQAWFEDFIDWFPLDNGGEARGNIGNADRLHLELTTTLKLDEMGLPGVRIDATAVKRWMSVTDPFTGEDRPFSYDQFGLIDIDLRHDIPDSEWAWGAGFYGEDIAPYSRRYEFGRDWEGPYFGSLFVEHKDVFGLTVEGRISNLLGARNRFERTVFAGPRPDSPVLFREDMNRRIGPIFRMSVSGDF